LQCIKSHNTLSSFTVFVTVSYPRNTVKGMGH
jgi:hypothetical protein